MKKGLLYTVCAVSFFILLFAACEEQTPTLTPPTLLSPANGATITDNPPTFIWSTVDEEQINYCLDVSTDSAFTDTCICISMLIWPPDTQYLPDSAFAPGTYYWYMCTREDC